MSSTIELPTLSLRRTLTLETFGSMSKPLLLGIEIGGTKLQLGLGFGDGRLVALERRTIEPANGASGILEQIRDAHSLLLNRPEIMSLGPIVGVGVGFGGPVDDQAGAVIKSYQVEGWEGFPLANWLVANLSIPHAILQNDADTAGLAEARYGAGQGFSPVFYVTIGSGIGGALIIDGQIYRGSGQGAAEIGHLQVLVDSPSGPITRELEQVASGWGIGREGQATARRLLEAGQADWPLLRAVDNDPSRITGQMIGVAAIEGDPIAYQILEGARNAIVFALKQAIVLLAPRRIILGGGVSLLGETHWHKPIRRLIDRDVFAPFRSTFDIVGPKFGEEVVVHGAIALAADATSNPNRTAVRG